MGARRLASVLLSLGLLSGSAAHAEDPLPPKHRVVYDSLNVARYNPLGFQTVNNLGWRLRLTDKTGVLWKDTHAWLGATSAVSPAFARGGLRAQVMPIALFQANATFERVGYFGTFDQVQGTADPGAFDWSPDGLAASADAASPRSGWVISAMGRLQAKVGPIAVRYTSTWQRFDLNLPAGEVAFYDQIFDIVVPDGAWALRDDADVIYNAEGSPLTIGARWTRSAGLHPGDAGLADEGTHRVGPVVAYRFKENVGTGFAQPTLLVLSQWWVKHPWRTGDASSQAVPCITVAFAFNGDLRPW